jgi:hypothetical protein
MQSDETISIGDSVIVPVGKDNSYRIATVEEIEFFALEESPFPVNRLKYIISKA